MKYSILQNIKIVSLTIVFLVIAQPVFAMESADEIEAFLNSEGVVEQFKKAQGKRQALKKDEDSPLVKQAADFGLYLNPPPKPEPVQPKPTKTGRPSPTPAKPMGPVSVKFDLIATSYYRLDPNLSLALIKEPAKDMEWIRQSDKIGHLAIKEIKDGSIVIQDGSRTDEIFVERKPRINLLKGGDSAANSAQSRVISDNPELADIVKQLTQKEQIPQKRAEQPAEVDPEQAAIMDRFVQELKTLQESSDMNDPNAAENKAAMVQKLISTLNNDRVSPEEAGKLEDMGQELKNATSDERRALIEKLRQESREKAKKTKKKSPK